MLLIREYLDERGHSPFGRWFEDLDARAAAKVTVALARIEMGNLANVKASVAAFWNTASTGGRATGCISAETARAS